MAEDNMKFLRYDVMGATVYGKIKEHPQDYMRKHFDVIHSVPQSVSDSWWFCVKDFDFELPPFIKEMSPYNLKYWRDGCHKDCEFFKRSVNAKTQDERIDNSCFGGMSCLKEGEI